MQSWRELFEQEMAKPYWPRLQAFVAEQRGKGPVYPGVDDTFAAFRLTPLRQVRVVIVGQDPYHGPGQAHGLAFSVPSGVQVPPSLSNILTELRADLGSRRMECAIHDAKLEGERARCTCDGNLEKWARQGVLLINTALTVDDGVAGSHSGKGWERFTSAALMTVAQTHEHVVFLRWGSHARAATRQIVEVPELFYRHTWIDSTHPSPLAAARASAGAQAFNGSRPFSKTNTALVEHEQEPIDWRL